MFVIIYIHKSIIILYLFKATRYVYIVYFDLIFLFVFVLEMRRLRSKKTNQFAQNFDIVFFSEHHCELNPGNRRKFNTLKMEINLKSCPSIGKKSDKYD